MEFVTISSRLSTPYRITVFFVALCSVVGALFLYFDLTIPLVLDGLTGGGFLLKMAIMYVVALAASTYVVTDGIVSPTKNMAADFIFRWISALVISGLILMMLGFGFMMLIPFMMGA